MIKLERVKVMNIAGAVYASRNAHNSWDKSDSDLENDILGVNDLDLAKRLAKAGSDHRKYMRQIFVSVDITAPLYWWKEFDTYKVGTTANSCSTMHTIHKKEFELDDFSLDQSDDLVKDIFFQHIIPTLNIFRKLFCGIESGDRKGQKHDWYSMIQLLPSSYNQKRTVTMNYENLVNMYHARKNHKLDEWREFCGWVEGLPYSEIITGKDE